MLFLPSLHDDDPDEGFKVMTQFVLELGIS